MITISPSLTFPASRSKSAAVICPRLVVGDDAAQIPLVGVDAGADGGAPHVEAAHLVLGPLEAGDVPAHRPAVGPELLPQTDGHRVLQLSPAHLHHIVELHRLVAERLLQALQLLDQPRQQSHHGQLARAGYHVVGGLGHVHMIVGMDDGVIPLPAPQDFNGPVGNHFIRIHIC